MRKTLIILSMFFVGILFYSATMAGDKYNCDNRQYEVADGDTLWRIAERFCQGNIQSATDDAVKTYGNGLSVGMIIIMPSHNGCEIIVNKYPNYEKC